MPATRRAADPSADACVWTDTEETCAVKSKALNTEQCGVPDDAGLNWNLLSESQCGESLFPYFLILFISVRAIRMTAFNRAFPEPILAPATAFSAPRLGA